MWPELSMMNWVWSDPPSHKIRFVLHHPDEVTHTWSGLKSQVSYLKKWPKCSQPHSCYAAFSLPHCTNGVMGSSVVREKGDLCLVVRGHHKSRQLQHYRPSCDIPKAQWWRESLPVGRTSSSTPCCLLAWKEKWSDKQLDTESWAVTNGLPGWLGN